MTSAEHHRPINTPDAPVFEELCAALSLRAGDLDRNGEWPVEQLALCGRHGVYRWFLTTNWGGYNWTYQDVARGYLRLSAACLTTSFILTQRTGAVRRIAASRNERLKAEVLPALAAGELFASVGISHLTTSRRHFGHPVLTAEEDEGGFRLNGYCPWVTGAPHCDLIVTGATLPDQRQILLAVPARQEGVRPATPESLVALNSSHTGSVEFHNVFLERQWLLEGPAENVMTQGIGARTGGLETSALALGLTKTALDFLEQEAEARSDLVEAAKRFRTDETELRTLLLAKAQGDEVCSSEKLRSSANSLVLRVTQATLAAAKGAGFVHAHPAGRWCREALFFLVWSCPQPVLQANLCELAWLDG